MSEKKQNILYLGCSNFPYGLAEVQKLILVSKALLIEKADVTVICNRGNNDRKKYPNLKKLGHFQGIKYIYSSGSPFREEQFFGRNFKKIFEPIQEFKAIYRVDKKLRIDTAIISSQSFRLVFFYWLISKILRFKLLLNLVEVNSEIARGNNGRPNLNDYLFDKLAIRFCDGVLPISEYLVESIKENYPNKPYLKIPVLVDMNRYKGIEKENSIQYFLFCGSVDYKEVIIFIIQSFELIDDSKTLLYLVINGRSSNFEMVERVISGSKKSHLIKTFSSVPENELFALYKNALALLIPLRPSIQDKARFPHKIGEYLASGNPIITTNYGEIVHYFKDMDNAMIANDFNEAEYAQKMEEALHKASARFKIGEKGKKTAESFFDYSIYGKKILDFIDRI